MPKGNKNKNKGKGKSYLLKGLDKKSFKKEMRAAIRQEFGAAQRGLQKEARISKATQRRNADYFGEYQQQLAQMQQQNQQGTQQAINQMGGFANQMVQQTDAANSQVAQQNAQSAQLRGATPGAQVQGQGGLVGVGGQMAGQIASQGQAQSQMLGAQETAAIQEKNSMRKQQQLVRRTVREELRQLKKDKGAAKSTYLSEAREGERRYDLGKRELRQSKASLKQQRQADNRGNKTQKEIARKQNKNERWKTKHGDKDGGKSETGGRTKTGISNEVSKAMGFIADNPIVPAKRNFRDVFQGLKRAGFSPIAAKRAAKRWLKLNKKDVTGNVGEGLGIAGKGLGKFGSEKKGKGKKNK